MSEKIGLIIQGPLMSKGRTGKTADVSFGHVKESDIVDYNCIENIRNLFAVNKEKFDNIVCVTWMDQEPELLNSLENVLPKENIHLIEDNTRELEIRGSIIPGNNKYRQFLSTYEGARKLKESGCKHIIKIRTDQFVDCSLLIKDYFERKEKIKGPTIFVPWINEKNQYTITEIPDFYFASSVDDLMDFSLEFQRKGEVMQHVHTDIFYKWTFRTLTDKYLLRRYLSIIGKIGNSSLLRIMYRYEGSRGYFVPLSNNVVESTIWRGQELKINYKTFNFNEVDYEDNLINIFDSLMCLFSIVKKRFLR
ncbi:hypothetical protein C9980_20370 [Vibrio mediterranei]|uniref:hypothetical protein n=1 Tax=Vibrio mediterranei TaxID=689 RepID=UPI000D185745|nr:hypothetical protein [Vibrio mediterranei]PTC02974.1 hypothetical protein C9980_20370 [Vibrio mediterranei]